MILTEEEQRKTKTFGGKRINAISLQKETDKYGPGIEPKPPPAVNLPPESLKDPLSLVKLN
jgi:hypothetical protein